ncbi:hypothetical protein DSECCO2_658280 [anaerobic digester metagenome]
MGGVFPKIVGAVIQKFTVAVFIDDQDPFGNPRKDTLQIIVDLQQFPVGMPQFGGARLHCIFQFLLHIFKMGHITANVLILNDRPVFFIKTAAHAFHPIDPVVNANPVFVMVIGVFGVDIFHQLIDFRPILL